MTRQLIAVLGACLVFPMGTTAQQVPQRGPIKSVEFRFGQSLGLGVAAPDGPCVLFPVRLDEGARLTAVYVPVEGVLASAEALPLVVERRMERRCDIPEGGESDSFSFAVRPVDDPLSRERLYAVFVSPGTAVELDGRTARAELDGMPPIETFRSCTGSESVHVSVWSGEPLKGIGRWRGLQYLGYDVVPTCTEADFQFEIR